MKKNETVVRVGDTLDTNTIVYAYNCSEFICTDVGLFHRLSKRCQRNPYRHLIDIFMTNRFFQGDCIYIQWSAWSSCQADCKRRRCQGIQVRQRYPVNILTDVDRCRLEKEFRSCQLKTCNQSCLLSSWSKWSRCSKSCNLGKQIRTRFFLKQQPNCTDRLEETRDCNPQDCCTGSSD